MNKYKIVEELKGYIDQMVGISNSFLVYADLVNE